MEPFKLSLHHHPQIHQEEILLCPRAQTFRLMEKVLYVVLYGTKEGSSIELGLPEEPSLVFWSGLICILFVLVVYLFKLVFYFP